MKQAAATALFLLFVTGAAAHTAHFGETNTTDVPPLTDALDELDTFVSAYNENADSLPSLVKSLVSGERVNVHIDTADGEIVVGAVLDGAQVTTVKRGGIANATVEFHTDEKTVTAILAAENPRQRALDAFNSEHITYEAHGFGRSIKFAIISTVSKVLGFLI